MTERGGGAFLSNQHRQIKIQITFHSEEMRQIFWAFEQGLMDTGNNGVDTGTARYDGALDG